MYDRLSKIDDLTRPDHSFISADDVCYYLGEYTARGGYAASETNQLIINLKKSMDLRGTPQWRYKVSAMRTVKVDLQRVLGKASFDSVTLVPIPPSKAKTDPLHDPRLVQILQAAAAPYDGDVRDLVICRESVTASHRTPDRASVEDLMANYSIDEALARQPIRHDKIVIFDDVLTTGRHYKAMQLVLGRRFPQVKMYGLFIARRAPKTDDFDSILDLL